MKKGVLFCFLSVSILGQAQSLTANQLLEKSIPYNDPEGKWNSFEASFHVVMETPKRPKRTTAIELNFPAEYFKSTITIDGITTTSAIEKGNCTHWYEGSTTFTEEVAAKHGLNCERMTKMRNYYVYLYGLPMKLKDLGTQLEDKVYTKILNGESFLCLKATYAADVGKDSWYFYFDIKTYAMRHYQFYHDELKNDGEYILLSGEENVQGIKISKTRAWYTNQANAYLDTDVLTLPSEK